MDYREALDMFSTNALNTKLSWEESICLVLSGRGGKQEVEGH